jgi:signal transduction histidine kinase
LYFIDCCKGHAFPEVNEDGVIENIIGCFTDITPSKKAELLQQKRSEDALAAKKLQEAFVDITSHELRNPMAVVLLECESIINSLAYNGDVNTPLPFDVVKEDALSSTLDAAKTIMHCVTHQRRIVESVEIDSIHYVNC